MKLLDTALTVWERFIRCPVLVKSLPASFVVTDLGYCEPCSSPLLALLIVDMCKQKKHRSKASWDQGIGHGQWRPSSSRAKKLEGACKQTGPGYRSPGAVWDGSWLHLRDCQPACSEWLKVRGTLCALQKTSHSLRNMGSIAHWFAHPLIEQGLIDPHYGPGTMPGAREIGVNKIGMIPTLREFYNLAVEKEKKQFYNYE